MKASLLSQIEIPWSAIWQSQGKSISKDLKRGAPVDITIQINESRELSVMAYLPDSDITLNARETLYFDAAKIDEVKKDFTEQVSRSESMMESCRADK